jgi:hypothetical protein
VEVDSPIPIAAFAAVAEILAHLYGSISSWPGAMDVARSPDAEALARELTAALGVLAGARRALADDQLPQLQHLIGTLERLEAALAGLSAPERAGLQRQLLAALDEAAGLAQSLGAAHARTQAALRRVGAKRRADRAYRQANRL